MQSRPPVRQNFFPLRYSASSAVHLQHRRLLEADGTGTQSALRFRPPVRQRLPSALLSVLRGSSSASPAVGSGWNWNAISTAVPATRPPKTFLCATQRPPRFILGIAGCWKRMELERNQHCGSDHPSAKDFPLRYSASSAVHLRHRRLLEADGTGTQSALRFRPPVRQRLSSALLSVLRGSSSASSAVGSEWNWNAISTAVPATRPPKTFLCATQRPPRFIFGIVGGWNWNAINTAVPPRQGGTTDGRNYRRYTCRSSSKVQPQLSMRPFS